MTHTPEFSPLGIIAGSGSLPGEIIEACTKQKRPVFVVGFEGGTDMTPYLHHPHACVRLGAVEELFHHLNAGGVKDLVMAGGIKRPSLSSLKPDARGAKLIARMGMAFFGGDDALLRQLILFFEEEGFRVLRIHDILPDVLAQPGTLGKVSPSRHAMPDIEIGIAAARALGARDAGQAVVVENGQLLAEEDENGTEALLAKCALLRKSRAPSGILVKAKKPQQEDRADLPAIGIHTVQQAHAAGLAGIAVEAGSTIIIDSHATTALADKHRLFLYGITHE